jgi:hypothetical protein
MALEASAFLTLNPAFHEPQLLVQVSQSSAFIDLLEGESLRNRLGEDDLLVYMKQLNMRSKVAAGGSAYNELPGADLSLNMLSTPTYLLRTRAQWDHHDVAAGARWGLAVPEGYRLALRQANYQMCRDFCLYGGKPQYGEGLVNAPGATAINLPADSLGHTTASTYDNGEMAQFLLNTVLAMKTRTYQLGLGKKFSIVGPQRILGLFEYNIVQLAQYQRVGAGTASTKETFEAVLMSNGDRLTWGYDDTLQGQGAGGTDLVILDMPGIEQQNRGGIDTNVFSGVTPGSGVIVTQYCDKAAPSEIISPMPAGATDMVMEWRISPGWPVRPQGLTLISMAP